MPSIFQHFAFGFVAINFLTPVFHAATYAADSAVQPAKYVAPTLSNTQSQIVRFSQQPTKVGSQVLQQVSVDLEINSTITQSGQIANQSSTTVRRRQKRLIEVLKVAQGQVRHAKVSFPHSRTMSPENSDPKAEAKQVVEGKSYLITRTDQQLLVTDAEGHLPPLDQYEIVLSSMQTFGLPNPLAQFLTSRDIRLGDRFQLPEDIASRLLGFGEELGQVQQFELVLEEIKEVDKWNCAVFKSTIKIADGTEAPTKIDVTGQVAIEIASCRTIAANFSGPLNMKVFDTNYQYTAEGGLRVAIQSHYNNAVK